MMEKIDADESTDTGFPAENILNGYKKELGNDHHLEGLDASCDGGRRDGVCRLAIVLYQYVLVGGDNNSGGFLPIPEAGDGFLKL